jgi:tetratricopeptide (TPR) repeat protein
MIKRFVLLSLLLAAFFNSDLLSQSRVEIKNSFYDAESWILFEDYKEALPLYQQLLKLYPTNSNFKYRIGQCYINTPGEKAKAISYLEDAVNNINPKYKEGKFKETGAPHDALYYLANAYRINNQLDKAIETYNLFKKDLDSEVYDSVIVNMQIQSCINAKEIISNPVFIKEKNLGSLINESN